MKEKKISVRHPYFVLLKSGIKKVEGRLYDDFFRDLEKGDILTFVDESDNQTLKTEVIAIDVFNDFNDMIQHFGKEILGFEEYTFDETLETYNSFYTKEEIKALGVCGVSVKKL